MIKYNWIIVLTLLLVGCKIYKPTYTYSGSDSIQTDYSSLLNWAAHPSKEDESDKTPEGKIVDSDTMSADVFFIHPTTYTGRSRGQNKWNAPTSEQKLNNKTDETAIRFQASAFNHAGRVFAPRYRQAHLHAYFTKDKVSAKEAFELAYSDIKAAFEFYLKFENNGRPIILASHSQGTNHAERLIKEFFVGKPLKIKLVAAYLLGMPIKKDHFKDIFPCKDSSDFGCFVSWRTFKKGHKLPMEISSDSVLVTNPLSWTNDETYMSKSQNMGTLLFDFNKIYPGLVDAEVNKDILWANKPKFRGSLFLITKNYHPADINFYYFNIRKNAAHRVKIYEMNLSKQ